MFHSWQIDITWIFSSMVFQVQFASSKIRLKLWNLSVFKSHLKSFKRTTCPVSLIKTLPKTFEYIVDGRWFIVDCWIFSLESWLLSLDCWLLIIDFFLLLVARWKLIDCWLIDCWLIVGWLLIDCWLIVDWLLIDCWLIVAVHCCCWLLLFIVDY